MQTPRPLRHLPCLLGSLYLFAFSDAAVGQNLLQNPRFDTVLTPWTAYASSSPDPIGTGTAIWDTEDVDDSLTSGSAAVAFNATPNTPNAAFGISQCVDFAVDATSAVFGTRFRAPTGQTADGGVNVTIDVAFFSNPGCSGDLITGGSQGKTILAAGDLSDTVWPVTEIGDPLSGFDLPLPAKSAQVRLVVRRVGTNSNTLNVFFDQAYLAVNGTVPVELLRFEVD